MRSIALHNLKGGVGKTTTAVNLAWLAANDGLRTLVWDLDPQAASSMYLGVGTGLGSVEHVARGRDLSLAVRRTRYERLDILPADMSLRMLDVELEKLDKPKKHVEKIMEELGSRYDVVVLDAPPGMGVLSECIFRAADLLLVPIVPSPLGVYVYERMATHLEREGYEMHFIPAFFSMVDRRRKIHRELIDTYAGKRDAYLASTIPYAAEIEKMGLHRAPIGAFAPGSPSLRAFSSLWQETRARMGLAPHLHAQVHVHVGNGVVAPCAR